MTIKKYVAALLVLSLSSFASATTITYKAHRTFNGTPTGVPTFQATFDDSLGGGQVLLTMDYFDVSDAAKIQSWYFNVTDAGKSGLTATYDSGFPPASSITYCAGNSDVSCKADGDGFFDFYFSWPNSGAGQFLKDNQVSYLLTSAKDDLNAFDFFLLSNPAQGGSGPFWTAIKQSDWYRPSQCIADIGTRLERNCGDEPPGEIPEPGTLALLGLGLLGLGFSRRRRV